MFGKALLLVVVLVVIAASHAGATCVNSLDCKEGFYCNQKEKLCVAHAGDEDCNVVGCAERGHTCDAELGRCVYKASLRDGACNEENPCPEAYQECHEGRCVRSCKDNRECNAHEHCFKEGPSRGRCVAFGCEADNDCDYGEECTNNKCMTRVTCVRGDRIRGDCGRGRTCTSAGICLPSSLARCERDADCKDYGTCFRGVCTEDSQTYLRKKLDVHGSSADSFTSTLQTEEISQEEEEEEVVQEEPEMEQRQVREPEQTKPKFEKKRNIPKEEDEVKKSSKPAKLSPLKSKATEEKKKAPFNKSLRKK